MSTRIKETTPCTPAENSHPAPDVPCTCRLCGGTLDAKYQRLGLPDKPGYWVITCWNKSCDLYGFTRSAASYPTFDLAPYITKDQTL